MEAADAAYTEAVKDLGRAVAAEAGAKTVADGSADIAARHRNKFNPNAKVEAWRLAINAVIADAASARAAESMISAEYEAANAAVLALESEDGGRAKHADDAAADALRVFVKAVDNLMLARLGFVKAISAIRNNKIAEYRVADAEADAAKAHADYAEAVKAKDAAQIALKTARGSWITARGLTRNSEP